MQEVTMVPATRWVARAAVVPAIAALALVSTPTFVEHLAPSLPSTGGRPPASAKPTSSKGHDGRTAPKDAPKAREDTKRGDDGKHSGGEKGDAKHGGGGHDGDGHGGHDGDEHGDDHHGGGRPATDPCAGPAKGSGNVVTCLPAVAFQASAKLAGGRLHTAMLVNIAEKAGRATLVGTPSCAVDLVPGKPAWLDCRIPGRPATVMVSVTLKDGRTYVAALPVTAA
jgi:hypothetical protein